MDNNNSSASDQLSLRLDQSKKQVEDPPYSNDEIQEGEGEQPNGNMDYVENKLNEFLQVGVVPVESESTCIYKVPERIRRINPEAYNPIILSIGPFHNQVVPSHNQAGSSHNPRDSNKDINDLYKMEQVKQEHFSGFLKNRAKLTAAELLVEVRKWKSEIKIKECYAGLADFKKKEENDFLITITLDSCFIIEHFLRCREKKPSLSFSLRSEIQRDLLFLENQVPFAFLERLYNLANNRKPEEGTLEPPPPFITITAEYFIEFNKQNRDPRQLSPKHFTDLIRSFLLPPTTTTTITTTTRTRTRFRTKTTTTTTTTTTTPTPATTPPSLSVQEEMGGTIEHVYSVSQLSEAGVVFKVSESPCLIRWNFVNGVFNIPCFLIDDGTERYMRNIMAFEQCYMSNSSSRHVCQYFAILNFLINTEKDVSILVDNNIIVNWMGNADKAATMLNTLCKNITMPTFSELNVTLCRDLKRFYEDPSNKSKAICIAEYFSNKWKTMSTIAAALILIFTSIQAVCSIWSLVKQYKDMK